MFRIHTNGKTVKLSSLQLAEALVARSINPKVSDRTQQTIPSLAEAMAKSMEAQGLLGDSTPRQLLALGIGVGYYLNTFFRKNEVKIQEQLNANERHSDGNS